MSAAPANEWIVEPLASAHKRAEFACGNADLDRYLKTTAGQDIRRNAASVFIVCTKDDKRVLGYYTLNTYGIELATLPDERLREFAPYAIVNATLIGRLARNKSMIGQRMGEYLLLHALSRAARLSVEIASAAVIVEAIDADAIAFYRHYGFQPFRDSPDKLFLTMKEVKANLA